MFSRFFYMVLFVSFSYSECVDYNEFECTENQTCEWIEDIEWGSCSNYNNGLECDANENCNWECDDWGDWYTWLCYGSYYCAGGNYQIDTSYCDDGPNQLGDVNNDFIINVLDVIEVVNLIQNNNYNQLADMNDDQIINVLDAIFIINIILGR